MSNFAPPQVQQQQCYLCSSNQCALIHKGTRDKPEINVLKCANCGLVMLSEHLPSDHNYENGEMHGKSHALSEWIRETIPDDIRRLKYLGNCLIDKAILDFGCGNGNFIKMASATAKIAHCVELDESSRNALNNPGEKVKCFKNINESDSKYDYITLFHVLEHLPNPIEHMVLFKKYLNQNGRIIVEVPNADDALIKQYGCESFEDFTYWSFHLYNYNEDTLSMLAEKTGYFITDKKQIQRYGLANHLYWLAKRKPGGHKIWSFLDSEVLNDLYRERLADSKLCDTILFELTPM